MVHPCVFSSLTIAVLEFLVYTCLKATKHGKSNVKKRWKKEMERAMIRSLACGAGAGLERDSDTSEELDTFTTDGTNSQRFSGSGSLKVRAISLVK